MAACAGRVLLPGAWARIAARHINPGERLVLKLFMKYLCRTLLVLLMLSSASLVAAQNYELHGKWYTARWSPGSWNGKHSFPNVYCVTFPSGATDLGHGFFNKGGIYLTQVLYPEQVSAYIVASTIPAGRSAEEEMNR